ncbi:transposase [Clostridium sp. Mt-5]|uniref:Transposase n=1 Tax=Clostridium moutaii TaxID=3240932 RepID=A0ABV4BTC0_9CLOT
MVIEVCIDDFALKKRESYGTIMVDIKTHRILDMIDSREYETVKDWLKSYKNLRIISRDGSITYHNAITDSHPDAIQISDRFHLLKNLTSYAVDYLKKKFKTHISISLPHGEDFTEEEFHPPSKADENRKLTLKEKYDQIERLLSLGYCKTKICQSLNMDIRAYDKLISMTPYERYLLFQTKLMTVHDEKVNLKMKRVNEVRELKNAGCSNREISRRTGLNTSTIRKYLDENFNPVHASYGKKKEGKLSPFIKYVDDMLTKGIMGYVIEKKIRELGYEGSSSTIRHYIADWKRRWKFYYDKSQEKGIKTITIERKDIFKLLYNPTEKVKAISQELFERICSENPCFKKIHDIIWKFKKMLIDKNVDGLKKWIDNAQNLQIREISSFVNGLGRDFDAVRNSIKYVYMSITF